MLIETGFLEDILKLPLARITEEQFKPFLALFAVRDKNEQNYPVYDWVNFVGSPFGWVEVYERIDSEGKYINLLFKVPPICKTRDFLDKIPKEINVCNVVNQYKLHSEVAETIGENYFRENFLNYLSDPAKEPPDMNIALAWNKIFERYKMKTLDLNIPKAKGKPDNDGSSPKRIRSEF